MSEQNWTWPEWLGGWGIVKDEHGNVFWYESEGRLAVDGWLTEGQFINMYTLKLISPSFEPPTIDDWTKPVLNPNWKATSI